MNGNIDASGDWIQASTVNVEGNVLAKTGAFGSITMNGNIDVTSAWLNAGTINTTGNIMAKAATFNGVTSGANISVTGGWLAAGTVNVTGNLLAAATTLGATTVNGTALTVSGYINSAGNILGTGGILNSLTVNGNVGVTTAWIAAGTVNVTGNILATQGTFNGITLTGDITPTANNVSTLGTASNRFDYLYAVYVNGLSVGANYADLAEKYVADAEYEPGTVLMFGGDAEVTECANDMSTAVAGVVSTNPGFILNQELNSKYAVDVALTGRVPCKVIGQVRKGDMMVSAGAGRARAEANPRVGSVIGKALENFDGLEGVIEVVIGKH